MLNDREYAQLKEVYNNILRAISLEDDYGEINTVGCLEVIFKKNKCVCVAVVCDMDMNVIEKKEDICKGLLG